jgi:hypothetical protein
VLLAQAHRDTGPGELPECPTVQPHAIEVGAFVVGPPQRAAVAARRVGAAVCPAVGDVVTSPFAVDDAVGQNAVRIVIVLASRSPALRAEVVES